MLAGIDAFNSTFLADLNITENQISQANQQLSSGYRVTQASDDPAALGAILGYQNQIDQVTQVQANLNQAASVASSADGALASASNMLDQVTSIASEGASSTQTATTRSILGQQVQGIEQQLVAIANTTVLGHYIFGGDDTATQPYSFNWSVPGGVVRNNTAGNTATITNADGSSIVPWQTAQQILDAQNSDGTPAASNIFQNVYALGQALQNNDQAGVQAAALALNSSVTQLGTSTTSYGGTETWIQQSQNSASSSLTNLHQQLSGLRDADIAQAATELSLAQTAMQAALAAHGSLNLKSLFSYLG